MPFFSPEQIALILKGLTAKYPDIDTDTVANSLYEFDKHLTGEDEQSLCNQLQYIADEDLYGADGFIEFLAQIIRDNQPDLSLHSAIIIFLHQYNSASSRETNQNNGVFFEVKGLFASYVNVSWYQKVDGGFYLPDLLISEIAYQVVMEFIRDQRLSIINFNSPKITFPILGKAVQIFFELLESYGDQHRRFEPRKNNEDLPNENEQIFDELKNQLKSYLITETLPILRRTQQEAAQRYGVDITRNTLDVDKNEWLNCNVLETLLNKFVQQNFPAGLPKGYAIAKPAEIFDEKVLENKLAEAFEKAEMNEKGASTIYVPVNTGGHWIFIKVKRTFEKETINFAVLQIDSKKGSTAAQETVIKILKKRFNEAKINSEVQGTSKQPDGYSCGDRTMETLIAELLTDIGKEFPQKNYQSIKNPWENVANSYIGQDFRRVTLGLLHSKVPLIQDALAFPSSSSSVFDDSRLLLGILMLVLIACLVLSGFGAGALLGSALAVHVLITIFGVTASSAVTAVACGTLATGFLSAIGLWTLRQALTNAWQDLKQWFNSNDLPPPPGSSPEDLKPTSNYRGSFKFLAKQPTIPPTRVFTRPPKSHTDTPFSNVKNPDQTKKPDV